MAEGLFRHEGGDHYEVFSAGTQPSIVRPEGITVMRESGIDIAGHRSKSVNEFVGAGSTYQLRSAITPKNPVPSCLPRRGSFTGHPKTRPQ